MNWTTNPDIIIYNRLRNLLHYDPLTGIFTWIQSTNYKIKLGQIAGCLGPQGYIRIRFDGKYYQAQRLAWLYMTGKWPKNFVDHKDTIKHNNIWENLREATRQQNAYNRPYQKDNALRVKGVHLHFGKYLAQINVDGKPRYLGTYKTLEEAKYAYESVTENIQGEFAYKMEN